MRIVERFNPNQLVPVVASDNPLVRKADGQEVPRFIVLAVIRDGGDTGMCLWDHVRQLFYINWMRHNRFGGRAFHYLEELSDPEFEAALALLCKEMVIKETSDRIISPGCRITYEIHPSMFVEPVHDDAATAGFMRTGAWS